jgi:hypothetical protein
LLSILRLGKKSFCSFSSLFSSVSMFKRERERAQKICLLHWTKDVSNVARLIGRETHIGAA